MQLRNDEIIVWKGLSHMVVKGPSARGEFVITNKRLSFVVVSEATTFSKATKGDLWDLSLDRVIDVDFYEMKGMDHPLIRIRYAEDESFFTFPDTSPRTTLAAIRLFINAGRRIENEVQTMRGVDLSLKEDTLLTNGKMPKLEKDVPKPADQVCFQCGKGLFDAEWADPEDTSACNVCEGSFR